MAKQIIHSTNRQNSFYQKITKINVVINPLNCRICTLFDKTNESNFIVQNSASLIKKVNNKKMTKDILIKYCGNYTVSNSGDLMMPFAVILKEKQFILLLLPLLHLYRTLLLKIIIHSPSSISHSLVSSLPPSYPPSSYPPSPLPLTLPPSLTPLHL